MHASSLARLEKMVAKPTWKSILLQAVESKKIDPWDIDIVALADEFLKRVKELEELDLNSHANIILAAAILLKHKSEYLKSIYEAEKEVVLPEEEGEFVPIEIPKLTVADRIPPKRPITIAELMEEVEKAIKIEKKRQEILKRVVKKEEVRWEIEEWDVEKEMEALFKALPPKITFFELTKDVGKEERTRKLLTLLHLSQEGKVALIQEKLFSDFIIEKRTQ